MQSQSVTATSASVSWEQPQMSFTASEYTIGLTRVTGCGQALCPTVSHNISEVVRPASTMSYSFTNLTEFSTYMVTVTARFMEFDSSLSVPGTETFTTVSAGM